MSLMNFGPSATKPPTAIQPVQPTQVRPVVVDNQQRPISSLRGFVEGMRCVTNYYSQITNGAAATYGHDTGKTQALQQFVKINRFEIILDGDIQSQQNSEDKTFTISGSAFVTSGLVPNAGDMFSIDAGNGRTAVMQVNNSSRMTAVNDTVYQIEFTQMFYGSDERYADLERKVIQQTHYLRDYAQFGKDPVVTDQVFKDLKSLSVIKDELISDYLRSFTNHGHKLLMVGGQSRLTHDPYCARMFRDLVNTRLHPDIDQLRFVVNGVDDQQDQPTLWDALMQRRPNLLIGCRDRSHYLESAGFRRTPVLRTLRYSGAQVIVFPYSRTTSLEDKAEGSMPWTPEPVNTPGGAVGMLMRTGTPTPLAAPLLPLHPVCKDGFYVLSEAFYTGDATNQSLLEKLTWDYLQGEGISSRDLHYLVSNHRAWTAPERYFYVPIVLVLIQASLLDAG